MTRTKTPAEKWRTGRTNVAYALDEATPFGSEAAAFAAVRELTSAGEAATVWHFEDGHWRTWEKTGADGQPA
jgi:hypothetical protein